MDVWVYLNSYQGIIDAYNENSIKEVFALAHSFKGVTGNLSLTRLFNVASELTEATRNKEEANIDDEIARLKEEYQSVERVYKELLWKRQNSTSVWHTPTT